MEPVIEKAGLLLTNALVYHTDIVARSAKGINITATDGRTYMDFTSGLATANIGHCHPKVVEAAKAQIDKLIHSGCIFYYPSVVELAEALKEITPNGIDKFFFGNSGAEAVEGAIKLARHHTGRQGIIAFNGSFHGRTFGALSLTASSSKYHDRYHPLLPGVYHVPYPYCYRCPVGQEQDSCSTECFKLVESTFAELISPSEVACIIIEPVLGEGGYIVPPKDYIVKLRDITSASGILLIADEVQSGFGRTGEWFGSDNFSLRPDIITMAKGIASGFPLGAIGASSEIMDAWPPGAHGTTFGGNPVSCAAGLATIKVIKEEGLLQKAREIGAHAMERLNSIKKEKPSIGDVRGLGFMIGVELVKDGNIPAPELFEKVAKKSLKEGLIILESGRMKNIARLMPPLITTNQEMDRAIDIIEGAL